MQYVVFMYVLYYGVRNITYHSIKCKLELRCSMFLLI